MDFTGKKIGVWGLGAVGKSAVAFFRGLDLPVEVMNNNALTQEQQFFLNQYQVSFYNQKNVTTFLQRNNLILASPGIDLRPFTTFKDKWITELDIFGSIYKGRILAITGSVGKTTVTTLLSQILINHGLRILTGGNIGTPLLDLLKQPGESDWALLEVSSFQLEHCKTFAPDIAVITNIYLNHLDRHDSFEQYKKIKFNISKYQNKYQRLLIPSSFYNKIPYKPTLAPSFFDYNDTSGIMRHNCRNKTFNINTFPKITLVANWTIICCVLKLLDIPLSAIDNALPTFKLPEHRLEKVATINDIDFYNDSKSTTPEATLAAVEQLKNKPIILLLGGLSKGIDREPLIQKLKNNVKMIICFGKEAEQLNSFCIKHKIVSGTFTTLESAFDTAKKYAQPGEQILLSPAGSSFDLFKNYEKRGKYFKLLVDKQK